MLRTAVKILRSFRSSDFHTDEEKEDVTSDISIDGTSPESGVNNNTVPFINTTVGSELDKINNSGLFQHQLNNIKPRASIRTKSMDLENVKHNYTQAITEKSGGTSVSHDRHLNEEDDDSVMIIDDFPSKSNVSFIKSQHHIIKKDELSDDDEEPDRLVIDLDDNFYPEEQSSNDSQSSYHTSPQEVFDLCETEPKIYKVNKNLEKEGEKEFDLKSPNKVGAKEKVGTGRVLRSHTSSQPKLNSATNGVVINKDHAPGIKTSTTTNNDLKSGGNFDKKVKSVEDDILRVKLPVKGRKKVKLFNVKISQVLGFLKDKNHPLHKWQDILTLENINELPEKDKNKMVKILVDFLEVKVVPVKSK